ncbi:MAG: VOC family protein [Tissierellales bacterium]
MQYFGKHPVRQIAYFVPDVEAAALRHSALFGSGPYFVAHNIPLSLCRYRGQQAELDHSSAYGQWGEVMIEFVQQNNPGPSVFKDIYPTGQGFHHVALIVDNLEQTRLQFEEAGYPTALYAEVGPGAGFAMMDCVADYGHFVELYEPSPPLLGVYDTVKSASTSFDGTDVIRYFSF